MLPVIVSRFLQEFQEKPVKIASVVLVKNISQAESLEQTFLLLARKVLG